MEFSGVPDGFIGIIIVIVILIMAVCALAGKRLAKHG